MSINKGDTVSIANPSARALRRDFQMIVQGTVVSFETLGSRKMVIFKNGDRHDMAEESELVVTVPNQDSWRRNPRVGDVVKLKKGVTPFGKDGVRRAKIKALLNDIEGGVHLDEPLGGCRYWNVEDLDLVARAAS